jgi:CubicO group peptidase (beta-lactamase class C family)
MKLLDSPAAAELRDFLESDAFSGVAAVLVDGGMVLEFAGGTADRRTGRPNRPSTRFATASVGKMFTAVCVARLIDQGHCRFEEPLVAIVPELAPHFDDGVTLATLLSHRSGLGDYIDDDAELPFAGLDVARLDRPEAFLPLILEAPRFPAGEFRYSSAGYILLGLAIERITGLGYPEAIARWVTKPAGMTSTGFPRFDAPPEDMAVGYLPDDRPNFEHVPIVGGADGGIVTTVDDLLRFFESLRSDGLLREATRRSLWQSVHSFNERTFYGYGFYINHACGRHWCGHTGSDPGVSARVAFTAAANSSIVVLSNQGSAAFRVFRLILRALEEIGAGSSSA